MLNIAYIFSDAKSYKKFEDVSSLTEYSHFCSLWIDRTALLNHGFDYIERLISTESCMHRELKTKTTYV